MKKGTEISKVASDEVMQMLAESFPQEEVANRIRLPRLGMYSQDQTEGKGKSMKVVAEAGTFYLERESDEVDEATGKKIWVKDEIGKEIDVIIFYRRHQLSEYDSDNGYTSSPVFNDLDEVVPLFHDKKEVDRGVARDLIKKSEYTDKDGKKRTALNDNAILYVLYEGVPHQISLRGSSMYAYLAYARNIVAPQYLTALCSEEKQKGDNVWNQMTFTPKRKITPEEGELVLNAVRDAIAATAAEGGRKEEEDEATKAFNAMK
jgi:hypothetical protein